MPTTKKTTPKKKTEKKAPAKPKASAKGRSASGEKKPLVKKESEAVKPKKVARLASAPAKRVKKLPYLYAVGRRKTSTARVRLYTKDNKGEIIVNEKDYKLYFPFFEYQQIVEAPFKKLNFLGKYRVTVKVTGGGKRGQAEAVRHGIGRVLLKMDESLKKTLRGEGYLTRDSRKKERKKPGLKRARRAPQWAKR